MECFRLTQVLGFGFLAIIASLSCASKLKLPHGSPEPGTRAPRTDVPASQDSGREPGNKYAWIAVDSPNGWYLCVYPRGGGVLGAGSVLQAPFPEHTFDFKELARRLEAEPYSDRTSPGSTPSSVNFAPADGGPASMHAVSDFRYIRSLFKAAHSALDQTGRNDIDALWFKQPPSTQP